jgi:hypothetical protein
MRLGTIPIAVLLGLLLTQCPPKHPVVSSNVVISDGAGGGALHNFVPLSGGVILWQSQDLGFKVSPLGHWPCALSGPTPSGASTQFTCDVPPAKGKLGIWPYFTKTSPTAQQKDNGDSAGTLSYMHVGPCTSCPGTVLKQLDIWTRGKSLIGGLSTTETSTPFPIYCDNEGGPAEVTPTTLPVTIQTKSDGTLVQSQTFMWEASGDDPQATIQFTSGSPCDAGQTLQGQEPACVISKAPAQTAYPYKVTNASGCSASTDNSLRVQITIVPAPAHQ